MSILNISPLINLTIAEQGTGEIDMLVTPIDVSNALINYTFMNQQLQSADDSSLPRGSPRITKLAVNIFRASDCLVASKGGSDGGYIDLLPQQPIDWNTFTFIGKGANISTTAQWNCVIYPAYCIYNVCPNATTVNLWAIET